MFSIISAEMGHNDTSPRFQSSVDSRECSFFSFSLACWVYRFSLHISGGERDEGGSGRRTGGRMAGGLKGWRE